MLVLLTLGAAYLLAPCVGGPAPAMFIIGGVYVLILLGLYACRHRLITKPLMAHLSNLLLNEAHKTFQADDNA